MAAGSSDRYLPGRAVLLLQTGVGLLLLWLALDGTGSLPVGLAFALLGSAAGLWLVPAERYPWRPLRILAFGLYFLRSSLRGGVDVALLALRPSMPIAPCRLVRTLGLPPGLPRITMLAITSLLPGTLCVGLEDDGRLRVHALTPRAAEGLDELEHRIARLFSLDGAGVGA